VEIRAILPNGGRDLRLDLFRGIANWAIFLNHMPENAVNWITNRNYGFSDAADLFVFISGYTASLVYARMMLDHGFIVARHGCSSEFGSCMSPTLFFLFSISCQ
jgi:hypothetical protein